MPLKMYRVAWIEANAASIDVIRDDATHAPVGYGVRVHTEETAWTAGAPTFAEAVDLAMAATAAEVGR
jgi:hypothetical protein